MFRGVAKGAGKAAGRFLYDTLIAPVAHLVFGALSRIPLLGPLIIEAVDVVLDCAAEDWPFTNAGWAEGLKKNGGQPASS